MDIVIVGIDLGKNSCSLAGLDAGCFETSDAAEMVPPKHPKLKSSGEQ
jgi:hypothetical protein